MLIYIYYNVMCTLQHSDLLEDARFQKVQMKMNLDINI